MKKSLSTVFFLLAVALGAARAEPIVKPGDSIAFLGDSITEFGNGTLGYVNLVMRGLEQAGITNVTKIAAGIGGHKSNDMLARVDRDCLSKKPTFMTVSCGVNDVWHGARGVPLEGFQANMSAIFDKAAASNVTVIVLTPTLIWEGTENRKLNGYVDWLVAEASSRGLRVVDLNLKMKEVLLRKRLAAREAGENVRGRTFLTRDGTHMAFDGDCMMATEILLKGFGITSPTAEEFVREWRKIPEGVFVDFWTSNAQYDALVAHAGTNSVGAYVRKVLFDAGLLSEE